jgi:hypothetical protein
MAPITINCVSVRRVSEAKGSSSVVRCDNLFDWSMVAGRRLAMSSLDKVLGWFPHTPTEWIEFIVVAMLLWLLMVVAVSELEFNSVIPV